MTRVSFGDLAQSQLLRRSSSAAETRLARLAAELASGKRSDLATATGGDFKLLAGIERSLGLLKSHTATAREAALAGGAIQVSLEQVQSVVETAANNFAIAGTNGAAQAVRITASGADQQLAAVVAALNVNVGERYLFSGIATDQRAVGGAEEMLSSLIAATTGTSTASGLQSAVRDWFDAPPGGGGFLDVVYGGSPDAGGGFPISPGVGATFAVTGADPCLRRSLEGLAMAVLLDRGILDQDDAARSQVLAAASETLMSAGQGIAELRGRIGTVEAAIDSALIRNDAEVSALEMARGRIVSADPYDTASALEEARNQLEAIYALTARLSNLSLLEFLR
ncbi:flagellin [Defluviimonas sp. WL0002]|uniref:Flagellin n=1 Tax=Albidovulum marisflavi TaxID=2984159 RepID=A0ABT2Z7B9_9RHOB|nr:flagellin [Defluviimonas sp. WL0002]MCV2867024.1 flagellin [Defluviimonas sp. WL0002]